MSSAAGAVNRLCGRLYPIGKSRPRSDFNVPSLVSVLYPNIQRKCPFSLSIHPPLSVNHLPISLTVSISPSHHHLLETKNVAALFLVAVPLIGGYQFLVTFSIPSQDPEVTPLIDDVVQKGWNLSAYQLHGVLFQYWVSLIDS